MRNLCLSIIVLILLPAIYFSSCGEDDYKDDNNRPEISEIRMNINDTIRYGEDPVNQSTLRINDSLSATIDTIVPGKWLYISVRLTDDHGLSTFKVNGTLTYRTTNTTNPKIKDSIYQFVKLGQDIFKEKDIYAYRSRLIQIPDTLTRTQRWDGDNSSTTDTLYAVEKEYTFYVMCLDMSGKKSDSIPYPVQLVSRENIVKLRTQ